MKDPLILLTLLMAPWVGTRGDRVDLSGTLAPVGPPLEAPVRVAAGPTCIVDLTQGYEVRGDLAGRMEIDFRILVQGPCGSPAGTYEETWIAHGTFEGSLGQETASGSFVYTAAVRSGGQVDGRMVFGDGLEGALSIEGRFSAGELEYAGTVERAARKDPSAG